MSFITNLHLSTISNIMYGVETLCCNFLLISGNRKKVK